MNERVTSRWCMECGDYRPNTPHPHGVTEPEEQPSLFDAVDAQLDEMELGLAGKKDGMARAEVNANRDWKTAAWVALIKVARSRREFTTEDVWKELPSEARTHEPRAMGPIMNRAAKERIAVNTERTDRSHLARQHARPLTVWRSLIYRGDA